MSHSKKIQLHAFVGPEGQGSPQELYFFSSLEERDRAFDRHPVEVNLDCGFVFLDQDVARLRWKNNDGEIQVCGSGAYALAWYLLHENQKTKIEIQNAFVKGSAYWEAGVPTLRLPGASVTKVGRNLYWNSESGIYFEETQSRKNLLRAQEILSDFRAQEHKNVHGYCLFFWDQETSRGLVRYFCPWHGRDEDSVTGSVQRFLTPLIFEIYGEKNQSWVQKSWSPGKMRTAVRGSEVILQGECRISTAPLA